MTEMDRRRFLEIAAALGATAAWRRPTTAPSSTQWREARDFFPEGVASGDPDSASVLLWTRRPPIDSHPVPSLTVEVAEDEAFSRVLAKQKVRLRADADWTCRVLVGDLEANRVYWYRFTD